MFVEQWRRFQVYAVEIKQSASKSAISLTNQICIALLRYVQQVLLTTMYWITLYYSLEPVVHANANLAS